MDKRKKGTSHQGFFWVYYDPLRRSVLFDYRHGRGRAGPDNILQDYTGSHNGADRAAMFYSLVATAKL